MNGENPAGDKTAKKRMQGRRRPDERGPSLSGSTPQTPPKPTPPRQGTAPSPLTKSSTGTDEIGPPRHQPSEPRKKKFCTMNRTTLHNESKLKVIKPDSAQRIRTKKIHCPKPPPKPNTPNFTPTPGPCYTDRANVPVHPHKERNQCSSHWKKG